MPYPDTPPTPQSPEWPFEPRSGIDVEHDIHTLLEPVAIELSPEDERELIAFAKGIFSGQVEGQSAGTKETLENLFQSNANSEEQTFYLNYIFTEKATEHVAMLGLNSNTLDRDQLGASLLDIEYVKDKMSTKARKELAADSLKWYKDWLAQQVESGDPEKFTDIEKLTVHYKPEMLLDKVEQLLTYKLFYRNLKRGFAGSSANESQGALNQAKVGLLEVHLARINGWLADLYGNVINLREQIMQSRPSDTVEEWHGRIRAAMPVIEKIYEQGNERREALIATLAERLDYIRNGAAINERGQLSPISARLLDFTAHYHDEAGYADTAHRFDSEILEQMDHTRWKAEQLKPFIEDVLREDGLLSEVQSTWDEVDERDGFTEDGLFQVVITPKLSSMAVSGNKRVVWVPDGFDRTLTQQTPAGVLPLTAHEITHVWQNILDYETGKQLPLARIKGRRYLTVREAGGTYQEDMVQKKYFGRYRPISVYYLHALEAKLQGKSKAEVIKVAYDSLLESSSELTHSEALEMAVDRTLRLYRNTDFNSQPLDYVEKELIMDVLDDLSHEEVKAFIIGCSSFNTHDAAKLKQIGLLNVPAGTTIDIPGTVVRVFKQKYSDAVAG